ncbi:MAG TPA: transcriptional regulator, partial [Terrisporobacter glycolicus]
SKLYGGTTVYIPVHRKVVLGERNREIVRQYNGKNVDKLRVKYGITSQQIRKILNDNG